MYQIFLIFIILIFTNANFALASEISHPPTYEQIKQSYKDKDQFITDIYEAFKYNSDDIEFLKQKKNMCHSPRPCMGVIISPTSYLLLLWQTF